MNNKKEKILQQLLSKQKISESQIDQLVLLLTYLQSQVNENTHDEELRMEIELLKLYICKK